MIKIERESTTTKSPAVLQFTLCCAIATLLSAFLVFQIQPVISKMILPWFGGGPAVWTSCMMFFQIMLLAGYAYAYSINRLFSLRVQVIVHMILVAACLVFLPIIPGEAWKPEDGSQPTLRILAVLLAHVGLPYLLLSATAPLLQAWYAAKLPGKIPYRLYALSNAGSLFALLSFPFLIEPLMGSSMQAYVWAAGFVAFALFCAGMAVILIRSKDAPLLLDPNAKQGEDVDEVVLPVTRKDWFFWIGLSGLGSFALLSISNHICLEMTVSPLMWVLPLSVYLLTFILNFEFSKLYVPRFWAVGCVLVIVVFAFLNHDELYLLDVYFPSSNPDFYWSDYGDHLVLHTAMSLLALFFICMLCHGELVSRKPHSKYLTSFYMAMATGGALGGMTVALVCPVVFSSFMETQITLVLGLTLACCLAVLLGKQKSDESLHPNAVTKGLAYVASLVIGLSALWLIVSGNWDGGNDETVIQRRNFYGVLRIDVEEAGDNDQLGRALYYGHTLHGFQFINHALSRKPTTYYSPDSGLALALAALGENEQPLRVGVVGLGAGTSAVYGREGDYFHFYEINPVVIKLAKSPFTYIKDSPAEIEITLADARVALERQPGQNYDLLVLDAFSGDAIPAHLLTMEAFEIYEKHLRKDGVIAIHISNRYLNLYPVVSGLAKGNGYSLICIDTEHDDDAGQDEAGSSWCLLSTDGSLLKRPKMLALKSDDYYNDRPAIQWTDQYSNLLHVLD
ncbi:MAG: fused MFS/spermidine synthase [Rubripirellula sp.]